MSAERGALSEELGSVALKQAAVAREGEGLVAVNGFGSGGRYGLEVPADAAMR